MMQCFCAAAADAVIHTAFFHTGDYDEGGKLVYTAVRLLLQSLHKRQWPLGSSNAASLRTFNAGLGKSVGRLLTTY